MGCLCVALLAVAPVLPRSITACALLGRRLAIRGCGVFVPAFPLRICHLTDDEFPGGDLVAEVLEPPFTCVLIPFACCLRHIPFYRPGAGFL